MMQESKATQELLSARCAQWRAALLSLVNCVRHGECKVAYVVDTQVGTGVGAGVGVVLGAGAAVAGQLCAPWRVQGRICRRHAGGCKSRVVIFGMWPWLTAHASAICQRHVFHWSSIGVGEV